MKYVDTRLLAAPTHFMIRSHNTIFFVLKGDPGLSLRKQGAKGNIYMSIFIYEHAYPEYPCISMYVCMCASVSTQVSIYACMHVGYVYVHMCR